MNVNTLLLRKQRSREQGYYFHDSKLINMFPMKLSRLSLLGLFIFVASSVFAQTKQSTGSGDWNNAATWTPAGVPTSTDNVLIRANHVIDISSNQACNSLTVGNGSNAQLRFDSGLFGFGGARSFTVNGNLVIANGASFIIYSGLTAHELYVAGDVSNNGTIDFNSGFSVFPFSIGTANISFIRNGNQNLSGSGILTRFAAISVNMGTSQNNIVDVSTNSFDVPAGFLTLTNGTFKYSKSTLTNITPFTTSLTIPSNAGVWMNSAVSTMSLPAGIVVSGKLSNSNGTLSIGDVTNETLLYSGGTFSFTGGVTNVAGRFNGSAAASVCNFNMSGGSFNVPFVGSNNTTNAPFQIGTAGSQFNMSGGTILINREGGSGAQDLGYVNLAGSGSVNGGTLQIGSATSPATQVMKINSTALIPNLVLNNATTTASLLTNAITVTNTIRINSGTLNSNNLGITLGGNWLNQGGTFTPGTSTVTFNSSAAQTLYKLGGETFNHLRFIGAGVKSFSSAITALGNFSISSGSSVNVTPSNHQLTVRGNFINSGTFNANSGTVLFNGTLAHTIGGSTTTDFFNLSLANTTNGAILTNPENLLGTLTLSGGTFNTNSQLFTMVSTATATARIASLTGTGDIIGSVRVQRFVPGGATGWALWGTPISSALTFNDWDDDISISCPSCPDGYVPNFPSIYSYSEAVTGSYSTASAYVAITSINNPIIPNRGYWVYVGDGYYTTNGITVDVTGTVRKGNQTIPLTRTNTGSPPDDGWNLIHNPYPSPISWTALRNGNVNVDNAIYCFNADLNGGTGASAAYVNGVSSPAVGSGGIGNSIPMSQGFYVHATANTNLTAQETNKVASTQAYLRNGSEDLLSLLRVNMNGGPNNFGEESVIYFDPESTTDFDPEYDAYKIAGQDPYAPYMAFENGTDLLQISAIPQVSGTYTTYLKTLTAYNGTYSITASENSLPVGACVSLFDRFTSTTTDLTTSDYIFNLVDTTTVARFILSISFNQLQITSNLTQPTCQNINGGEIVAIGNNAGPWNYFWKDSHGNSIKTTLNKATADTLNGLWSGSYQLIVTTVGGCDNNQSNYSIIQKNRPYASFSCIDTCYIDQDPIVLFNNTTPNSTSQSWDFGDSNSSTVFAPQHHYQAIGNYIVTLAASSSNGCIDTVTRNIVVANKPVGINTVANSNSQLTIKTLGNDQFLIQQKFNTVQNVSYSVQDISGRSVINEKALATDDLKLDLDLGNHENGVYFVSLKINNVTTVIKLIAKD